ncbi:hypothetical protein [Leptospira interrogans]|uniref:hypothetical protein n=1 Tax=Leptospira interrogans TaxID=173 RepID=UPI0002981018|nr:hypothetical protein [Leptospira interrogans]EKR28521.1 hypothetical protein LEP1GSC087_0539 [Leptospira interrogans serovar Bataviae str. L1111]
MFKIILHCSIFASIAFAIVGQGNCCGQIKKAAAMRPKFNKQNLCNPCSDPASIPKKK